MKITIIDTKYEVIGYRIVELTIALKKMLSKIIDSTIGLKQIGNIIDLTISLKANFDRTIHLTIALAFFWKNKILDNCFYFKISLTRVGAMAFY